MTGDTAAFSLRHIKQRPPRLPANLIHRRRLLDRLQPGLDRKLAPISALVGFCKTTLIGDPVDQAGLIGVINHVNIQALPLVLVECVSAPEENVPSLEDAAKPMAATFESNRSAKKSRP